MPAPRLLICDLDGTLIDSLPMVMAAFRHAVEPWKCWEDDAELRKLLVGNYLACLGLLMPRGAPIEAAVERLVDYSRAHEQDVVPFDAAEGFLEEISAMVKVAVWTNRDRHSTWKHLRRMGLDRFISDAVCGDDFPTHKPDPEGVRALLGRLGVAPAEALFLGDSDVDVEGGHAAGVATVLIRHGQIFEPALEVKAAAVCADQSEAYRWALRWARGWAQGSTVST